MFQGNKTQDKVNPTTNNNSSATSNNVAASLPAPSYKIDTEEDSEKKTKEQESSFLSSNGDAGAPNGDAGSHGIKIIRNSAEPAKFNSKAFTDGKIIHIAPGQDSPEVIGHEIGHIIQRIKKSVTANTEVNGSPVNNDPSLEQEADDYGRRFAAGENIFAELQGASIQAGTIQPLNDPGSVLQFYWGERWVNKGTDYVARKAGELADDAIQVVNNIGDAALQAALSAIGSVEELLTYLATLSESIAKRAISYIATSMQDLFSQLITQMPGSKWVAMGITMLMEKFPNPATLLNNIATFTQNAARNILRFINGANPRMIKDMLLAIPNSVLGPIMIIIMNPTKLAEFLMEAGENIIKDVILVAKRTGIAIQKILRQLYQISVEFVEKAKNVLLLLGEGVVAALMRPYLEMRAIVRSILDFKWPVGSAIYLDAGVGATFGIPLYVGGEYLCYVQRTSPSEFMVFRRGIAKAGVDTGVGIGVSVGGSGNSETKGAMVGAEAGASAQAGIKVEVIQEFTFPIFEDLAFISFLATATGTDTGMVFTAAKILAPEGANLDPMKYNTKTQFKYGVYGEASAEAKAGVRVGNENTDGVTRWSGSESRPDELGGTSGGPWYMPSMLLNRLNASAGAHIGLEANLGIEMRQGKFIENANGGREPQEIEMDIFGEGSVAANLASSFPFINIPLVDIDSSFGLKITYKFEKSGGSQNDIKVEFVGYSPYIGSGDMDGLNGAASETELSSKGTPTNLTEFLAGLHKLTRKQRLGLAGEFGKSFFSRKNRQQLVRQLNGNGTNWGFNIEGQLSYEFEIDGPSLREIFEAIVKFKGEHIDNGEWQYLADDILILFQTGTMPAYLHQFLDQILGRITIKKLIARVLVGGGVAGDMQASAGAKARLHGHIAGGAFTDVNLIAPESTLDVAEIRELLLNGKNLISEATGGVQQDNNVESNSLDAETTTSSSSEPSNSSTEMASPQNQQSQSVQSSAENLDTAQSELLTSANEFIGEDLLKLETVNYELIAHGFAYTNVLTEDQQRSGRSMGYKMVGDKGWNKTIGNNDETGFFAGLLMPSNECPPQWSNYTEAEKNYVLSKRAVLAFRGSETKNGNEADGFDFDQFKNDWLKSDMDTYAVGHTVFTMHYNEIEAVLKDAVASTGKRVVVTGHSLGGSLAKQCAIHFPQYVHEVYTYQAPGISEEQQEQMEALQGTNKDILGNEFTEDDNNFLDEYLHDSESRSHGMDDINAVSHTAHGDIVHLAGGGRMPNAQRYHHYSASIINGRTPAAHMNYVSSSEGFSEQHVIMNRILGNDEETSSDNLYQGVTGNEKFSSMRQRKDYEVTDSDLHNDVEGARRSYIGNNFNPQSFYLTQHPERIVQIPMESKLIMFRQLIQPDGMNPIKRSMSHYNTNRAIVNLISYSTKKEQIYLINNTGGITVLYSRIDNLLDNVFTSRSSEMRVSMRLKFFNKIDSSLAIAEIEKALNSGLLGFGDSTEEKIIYDILEAVDNTKGASIIEGVGDTDYDRGLTRILRKLQGEEDTLIRRKYKFKNKSAWSLW